MKNILRRITSTAAYLAALLIVPVALATPTISITSPTNGTSVGTAGVLSSPSGVSISVTTAIGSSPVGTQVASVNFLVNGTSIGTVSGGAFGVYTFSNWLPTAAGTYTLTAIVTDTSVVTTGTTPNLNTATSPSVTVTVSTARVATISSPANNATLPQNSQLFLRSTASLTDGVVSKVEFVLDPGTANTVIGTATQAPYNVPYTITAATGSHTILARVTATDGSIPTFDSTTLTFNVSPVPGGSASPTVSITAPSNSSYVGVGQAVTISAIASDTDGFIPATTGGGVTFYADGDPIGTDLTAPYSVSWTPTTAKQYSLRAIAIDDKANQTMSTAVSVTAVPALPTVALTAPANNATAAVNSNVTLTATATASTGATITQVAFFQNGTAIGAAVTASPYTTTFTPSAAGNYSLTAQVTDSAGITITSPAVNLSVTAAQPAVSLTAPTIGSVATVGSNVTVTANPTPGTGATIAQVQFLAGTNIIGTVTSAPYSVTWTPSAAGNFSLTARITDSTGATATSAVVATTVVTTPSVSITSPTNNSTATVGSAVTVTASASPSPGATVASVAFSANGTAIGAAVTTAPYSVAWTPSAAGAASLTATITDSAGFTSTSPAIAVNVVNSQPTVSLKTPTAGSVVTLGTNVSLTADATAGSGATITQVQFLVGTNVVGTDTTAPYGLTWVPTTAGNFAITARVTDSNNNTVTSTAVTITAAATTAVAITAPAANSTATVGAQTTVTASATPTLGATITSVTFYATPPAGGAAVQIGTPVTTPPYTVAWTPSATGAHTLTAVAVDSTAASVTSSAVAVTVNNSAPTISLTAPLPGAVVTAGSNVTVTATAVAGSGGATVTQVQFLAGANVIATLAGNAGSSTYTTTWVPASAANFTLTARVTDSNGNSTTSTAVSVTAVSATPPSVSITAPTTGSVVTVGANVTLSATATAGAGATIAQVQFLSGGSTVLGTTTTATGGTYSITWVPGSASNFSITARVLDTSGNTATSSVVTVTATAATSVALTTPANNATATVGTATTLTATATPIAGATITRVDFLAAGAVIGSATTAPYTFQWTPATAGATTLTAQAFDSTGSNSTSAAVNVTVNNSAPTVTITAPTAAAVVTAGSAVRISATALPGSGSASISQVQFFVGQTLIETIAGGAGVSAFTTQLWTPAGAGNFSLTARATDSNGNTTTSSAINVTSVSTTPTTVSLSMLPATTAIPVNSSRVLTASASAASGVAYVEFFYVGSSGTTTLIGSDTVPPYSIVFTAPNEPGERILRARATDNLSGTITSADLKINITGQIGSAPVVGIVTPTAGTFMPFNTTTTISGTATDADGAITGVQVFVNGSATGLGNGGVATLNGSAWSISWTPTTTGTASISAIATDSTGNAVAAPVVGVNVTEANFTTFNLSLSPRTAAAAASATIPSGAMRNVVADVTAATGRAVVRVEFFIDGTKVGEDTTAPYTQRFLAPTLAPGEQSRTYMLSARATDNAGSARDQLLPIQVISPVGAPPTVNLLTPANNTATVPGTAVTLAATATSLTGTIANVQFYVNGNPASVNGGNGLTAAPYVATFVPPTPGTYTVDAIATDDRGNTAISNSATVTASFSLPTIAITSPNPNATARATPNVPITLTAAATVQVGAGASVLLVEFLLDGVQIGARTSPTNAALGTYTYTWIPSTAQLGSHVLTARVTDNNSLSATSAPVSVNVANAVGTPPAITISTTPIPGPGLQTLSQVNFLANAFANGTNTTINNVEFFLNDLSIGLASREQTTNLYRLVYDFSRIDFATAPINPNNPAQFLLPLYAIARDSNNNQTVSATTNLTINAATSAPPTITLQALTATTVTQGSQVLLLPQFSDTDGTVTLISLYSNGGIVQNLGNPVSNQSFFTYTASTPGRFNLFAVATDDTGNTAIASPAITIQVNAVNAPNTTVTRPSDNSTITTAGAPVFLEGTAVASGTTLIPTLAFIATANSTGARTQINGSRVGTTSTYRAIWTPFTADTYTVVSQATVAGVQNTSTVSRNVVVNELIGIAPTISISVPGTVTTTSSANFTATSADSDGSVISVEFFVNRNSIGFAARDQLTNTWRLTTSFAGLPPGSTEVVARATDSSGNVSASGTSFINLVAASSIAPSITVTPSTTNAAFNRQVQLRANARDSDGTVTSVQYFANGTSLGTSGNANTSYQVNWTPTTSGTFNVFAVATDNTNNTTISATVPIVVRRNNPVLEEAAFILQTYQDIANTTTINPLVFDDLDSRLTSGALTRTDLVVDLMDEPGFLPAINLLATYYVIMGQWPTPANYTTLLATARGSLANAVNSIIFSNEYFAKFGVVPTTQLLDSPTSVLPAEVFLNRLHQSAGLPPPTALNRVQFRSFNPPANQPQLLLTQGRGYAVVGLPTAIAEFVTNTNSTNTALFKRARAAAVFYQLDRPAVSITVDEITERVNALIPLADDKAVVDAVLKDILYSYRYVTITKHPASLTVSPRSGAIFTVDAIGSPPLAYQWLLNGSPVPGATNSYLSLTNVSTNNAGAYTVAITSSAATATSDPATLTLSNTPTRLANISTRGNTSGGSNVLIGGFVVSGTAAQTRQMLIRVIGPTLATAPFNIASALPNPALELYAGNNRNPVLTNDDWGSQAAGPAQVTAIQQATARAGAFALAPTSRDAVVLATLPPGAYTVQATVPAATPTATGLVLIEVYDVTQGGPAGPKAANVSTRGLVGTGSNALIGGFVVTGAVSRRMLIRGVGPTLANFGVPGALADPLLTLVSQDTGKTIRTNDNWSSGDDAPVIAAASITAGAFPLASNSRDAAMIVMLEPGAYTVQLTGVGNTTGVGIVEVYDVDP